MRIIPQSYLFICYFVLSNNIGSNDIFDYTILVTIPFNRINEVGNKVGDKVGDQNLIIS